MDSLCNMKMGHVRHFARLGRFGRAMESDTKSLTFFIKITNIRCYSFLL